MHKRLPAVSRLFSGLKARLFLLLAVLAMSAPGAGAQTGGQMGFEDNLTGGWTAGSSTESVALSSNATNVRTGAYSLGLSTTTTSSNKYWYTTNIFGASASGTYVHFIYWALATDAVTSIDASMRYNTSNPPVAPGSTANGTAAAINASTWTRLSFAAGNSNGRYYFPAPRRTTGNITTFYMDDVVMYTSTSSTTDLTDPNAPTALTATAAGSNVNLAWTSATDAGTGVQATIVLRTANTAAAIPDMNDQAVYSTAGGATGPNAVGSWTVISTTTGAAATSYTDAGVATGMYKYAVILRDLAYNYSVAAVSPAVTVGTASPAITTNLTGYTGVFGNVVTGTNSAEQTYTVSGTALTTDITVTAPAGFQVSLTSGSGFGSSVTLAQAGGAVAATTIYVRYAPTAATGATGSLAIANASTGATTQNVTVSGNALAVEPTTAGTISFSAIGSTSVVVNLPTVGNGSKRIIVMRQGSAVTFTPADAVASTGVNANFSTATDQGSGNKIVYDGSGSGSGVVTVTGLTQGLQYYATVYEYNEGTGTSQNYLLTPVATGTVTTVVPTPTITTNLTGFTGVFGNVVTGTNSAEQTYTVSGTSLSANLVVTAPAGFQVSLTTGTGFAASVSLTPVSGTVAATTIYVRYAPTAATGATGSLTITNASTGATTQNVPVSGNALAVEPTTAGTITFGTLTSASIGVNLPTVGNGSKRIIVIKQGIAPTFTPTDGVAIAGVNADFSLATDQGGGNKVIYDGTGSGAGVVTVTGLTAGTLYYFVVYEYNVGTGTSQNYLLTPAAAGSATTAGLPSPAVTVNTTGFSGVFGNVVTGTNSAPQQYTVSGTNLTANIVITAPAGFQVSLASGSGFAATLSLTPVSGAVAATTIYVRYAPTAATGATGSLTITNASAGATTQNVTVSGNALAVEPTTAGTITFGAVTGTSIVVNLPTVGNGTKRIIVIHQGSAVAYTPTDGVTVTGVSAAFSTATDQGGGNKVVYDGTGSGSGVVTVTGLTQGTAYYFTVYEYNEGTGTSQNYLLSPAAAANTTTATPAIVVTTTGFTGTFGNVAMGATSAEQTYTVSGTNLSANIVITAPAGFQVSLTTGTGFAASVSLTPVSGTVAATTVFVRYAPTAATGATGSLTITNVSTGTTAQTVTVSGNALAVEPTTAGTITFGAVTGTSIVVNLPTVGNGTKRIIVIHQGSAVSYTPTDGVAPTGVSAAFGTAVDQGSGNKIVYNGTGSGTGVVTVTGLTQGTAYYFTVYEYNEGTGTSQNYLLAPAATANTTTGTPAIVVTQTGFTGLFGDVVTGTNSATQSYTVSGANLSAGIIITAPAGFQVSTNATSGFGASLTLTQTAGTVATTTIYVRYAPTAATGATGSLTITHASTGATTQNVTVSGNALAAQPTTAGTITFGTITANTIVVNLPTVGNGSKRIIVIHQGSAVTFVPADGVAMAGVNSAFGAATDQGGGNKVVYDGAGSGSGVVTVTGLTQGTTYYFAVYEYNVGTGTSQNYLPAPAATNNATTAIPPATITINTAGFNGNFGNVVAGTNSAPQSYTVSGANLTADITITAPTDFSVSLTSGAGYAATLTLPQTGGTVAATTIYVRYSPPAASGATGSLTITNASTGATTQNVTVSGNAIAVRPTTAGTITFGLVTPTSIVVNLPTVGNGARRIIVMNLGNPPGFMPADGVAPSGVSSVYGSAVNQAGGGRIIYDGTGAGNNVVTVTGLTLNTLYYFVVYEYNVGTGTSYSYLLSPAANSNMTTYIEPNGVHHTTVSAKEVKVFPNPTQGEVNIDAPAAVNVFVSDAGGRMLFKQENARKISLESLSQGIYILTITDDKGGIIRQEKILKVN